MKGLLIKELIHLRKGIKGFVIFGIVVLIFISGLGTADGATFALWTWFMTAGMGIMDSDVSSKFNRYNVTMPVSRSDIIKSKYLLISIYDVLGYFILFAGIMIHTLISEESILYEINQGLIFITISSLVTTISVVCIFWKGIRRGRRIALPVCIAAAVGAIVGLRYMERFEIFTTFVFTGYLIIVLIASVALRIGSMLLSIKLYEKRSL